MSDNKLDSASFVLISETADLTGVKMWSGFLLLPLMFGWICASELTFELPDNAKQCFYEDIIIGTKCTLEFQVHADPD